MTILRRHYIKLNCFKQAFTSLALNNPQLEKKKRGMQQRKYSS